MTALLLFSGCAGSEQYEEKFTEWRTEFLEKTSIDITADVTSVVDDAHGEYTLAYHRDAAVETVEVISPELIADVKAHMESGGSRLSFDGVMLETGTGIWDGLSPMTALPAFMDFIEEGYVKSVWSEKSEGYTLIVTELELSDGSRMTLWQDKTDMNPLYAAIRSGNAVEIKIKPIIIV